MMPSNFLTVAPAARNMRDGKADLVAVAEPMGPKRHFRHWRVANERSRVQADTHACAE